ncbi:MAG TPA: ISNCY family transposase [Polyangiaceae bacterium]
MRKSLLDQLSLTPVPIAHAHAQELVAVGALLDQLPEAVALVHEDLSVRRGRRVDPTKGRDGMAAEQVLRVAILKQHTGLSYERLAFALADSSTYRSFCRLGYEQKPPTKSALQKNVKRVSVATWERINQMVVRQAQALGVEKGTKVRTDCLVVESNIHHPTDSSLLWDCVRVLTRVMKRAKKVFGFDFVSHRLRAKRRALEIDNAASADERKPLYRDLLIVTEHTLEQAEALALKLASSPSDDMKRFLLASAFAAEIGHFAPLTHQVLSQTERRILRDESVPSTEKIVSIFEPHTSIIIKDGRGTEYGHKVCITTGASSLVTDVVVEQGNPADYTLATRMMQRQVETFGQPPKQAAFDGGFAAKANLTQIKALGVTDVVFHKRRGLEIEMMASSVRVFKKLRAFRAGIEGTISFLKRVFGLERCTWRSFDSFKAYVQASVLACNLLVTARRLLAA